jgi:hypothetical protein
LIAICLCQSQSLPALEQVATPGVSGVLSPLSVPDRPQARRPALPARALSLDAELGDRAGGTWRLRWTLLGDDAGLAGRDAHFARRAAVLLTAPDGLGYEKTFFAGTAHEDYLAAADDWEWHSQGESLLPARLRFDIDGRQVLLLLEALTSPGDDDTAQASRVRVRGFVNRGLDKTYVSGRGRLDLDWPLVAGPGKPASRQDARPVLPATE